MLFYILTSTFLISLLAFVGALALFLREKLLDKILLVLVAFSAGALFGGAFLHLIPEAAEKGLDSIVLALWLILGFCLFFILEQFIRWHHCSGGKCSEKPTPFSFLILVSDAVHNFIDGLVIAGSFAVALPVGMVTVLAVALHEIPQEMGDFGVLVYGGFKKGKALVLNFLSAVTVIIGGVVGFLLSEKIGESIVFLLPFAAGNFLYISASDLIPEIKHKENTKKSIVHFFVFLTGIGTMLLIKLLFNG
jgi:zinc and cadmium transporter